PSSGSVYLLTVVQGAAILRLPSISPQGMVFGIQVVDALVRRFVFRLPSLEAVDRVVLEPREAVDTVILKEGAMADYPRAGISGLKLVIPFTRSWNEPITSARVRFIRPDGTVQEYEGTVIDEAIEVDPVPAEDTIEEGSYQVQGFLRVSPEKEIPLAVQRFALLRSI